MKSEVAQSCPTLCNPMDSSLSRFSTPRYLSKRSERTCPTKALWVNVHTVLLLVVKNIRQLKHPPVDGWVNKNVNTKY